MFPLNHFRDISGSSIYHLDLLYNKYIFPRTCKTKKTVIILIRSSLKINSIIFMHYYYIKKRDTFNWEKHVFHHLFCT